jgi:hypothetical protein
MGAVQLTGGWKFMWRNHQVWTGNIVAWIRYCPHLFFNMTDPERQCGKPSFKNVPSNPTNTIPNLTRGGSVG